MQVTILSVSTETIKTAKGSYQKAEVAYKGEDGKVSGKNIMSFVNQKVFDTLKGCSGGETLNIASEQDKKGYWQWTAAERVTGEASFPASQSTAQVTGPKVGTATPRNTYETPEERAQKQIYIVRQSSVANALEYSKSVKALKSVDEVLALAKQFEEYVFAKEPAKFDDGFVGDEDQVI